jgi:hypothetical protein
MMCIAILTDFGDRDEYVGVIKGVIAGIAPGATLIDLNHKVQRHNLKEGAFLLASGVDFFPPGTIFLCAVNSERKSEREGLLIECEKAFFVGPDNGLMIPAARRKGIKRVLEIENKKYWRDKISSTFRGRDILAPVAGWLARGKKPEELGKEVTSWIELELVAPEIKLGISKGEVLHVDNFGNVITNIPGSFLRQNKGINKGIKKTIEIRCGKSRIRSKVVETYEEANRGEIVVMSGSSGMLELTSIQGNASKELDLTQGCPIEISFKCPDGCPEG